MKFSKLSYGELVTIYPFYKNAMESRRVGCALEESNFINHFVNGFENNTLIAFGDSVNGYILGDYQYDIFKPSHFAPMSKRSGYSLFKKLKHEDVVLFVTKDLAFMLDKIGYYTFNNWKVPMFFRGELVIKHIYTTCGLLVELINKVLSLNIDFNNLDIDMIKEAVYNADTEDEITVSDVIYRKFKYHF